MLIYGEDVDSLVDLESTLLILQSLWIVDPPEHCNCLLYRKDVDLVICSGLFSILLRLVGLIGDFWKTPSLRLVLKLESV